jgi:hypothetical protein
MTALSKLAQGALTLRPAGSGSMSLTSPRLQPLKVQGLRQTRRGSLPNLGSFSAGRRVAVVAVGDRAAPFDVTIVRHRLGGLHTAVVA